MAVDEFVATANLKYKKVLEVGAGSSLLQDVVADYTGLDTPPHVFPQAVCRGICNGYAIPRQCGSIWVLEHTLNSERLCWNAAHLEATGYLLLYSAMEVSRYASQGYHHQAFARCRISVKLPGSVFASVEEPVLISIEVLDQPMVHSSTHAIRPSTNAVRVDN